MQINAKYNANKKFNAFNSKIINQKIRKLAEIDRHEEFVAADFYM